MKNLGEAHCIGRKMPDVVSVRTNVHVSKI